ncbi:hypothetical protein NJ76_13550 [Rhodococcus sp. IITR03]|nr:hypothetical protein NJ76_13550 [Rhodococcus sp. IITR03]
MRRNEPVLPCPPGCRTHRNPEATMRDAASAARPEAPRRPVPPLRPATGATPPTPSAPLEMTASVPLGMALRPRISADDPEPESSGPLVAHEPARPENPVLPPSEPEAAVSAELMRRFRRP